MDSSLLEKEQHLIDIGIALSAESETLKLLEKVLLCSMLLTSADGGTVYLVTAEKQLKAAISLSSSLEILETSGIKEIALKKANGMGNEENIVSYAANNKTSVNIEDAYHFEGFDFSGPKLFDARHGYRTKSVLTVPMMNHEGDVIAVLQLINAHDKETKKILPFSKEDEKLSASLASQAGVALTNAQLIADLKNLFESFIKVIAHTIDEKSPMTGNHSRRVPLICEKLARACNEAKRCFSEAEIEELKIAALLHDCGKITTPSHIIDKHSKLETIFDRIELVKLRYEVLKREFYIAYLEKKIDQEGYESKLATLKEELEFLERCNHKPLTKQMQEKVREIAAKKTLILSADEMENLSIAEGNLTEKERKIIENHVCQTEGMLSKIIFPKHLKNVPEIASSHHERIDGKGYPHGLRGDQMSLQARILAVADIFEALSARDRPYKQPFPLPQIYEILKEKALLGHLDKELVDLFIQKDVGSDVV